MQLTYLDQDDTYLDYAVSTAPAPVVASESADALSHATLTIVISNHNPLVPVTLSEVEVSIPVGTLTSPAGADFASDGAFQYGRSDEAWDLDYPNKNDGYFTLKPHALKPIAITEQGIALTFSNIQITTAVGTAQIKIQETATVATPPPSPPSGAAVLNVPKFPYGFAVSEFRLAAPAIPYNTPATLSWIGTESPDTVYSMQYGETGPVNVTGKSPWSSDNLTETTTFMLEVSSGSGKDTVKMWFTATQVVENPAIVATKLEVQGDTTLDGKLSVGGAATAKDGLTVDDALVANGPVTVSGSPLTIDSAATTVSQGLNVAGTVNAGALNAGGTSGLAAVTVSGAATFEAGVAVNGQWLTLAGGLKIGPWSLYTDGDQNLIISNGDQGILISRGSPITMFILNRRVICDGDPVYISNDQGTLDGTTQRSGPGRGWTAAAYWSDNCDGDCALTLKYGNPWA